MLDNFYFILSCMQIPDNNVWNTEVMDGVQTRTVLKEVKGTHWYFAGGVGVGGVVGGGHCFYSQRTIF